jgi:hypothetical protein
MTHACVPIVGIRSHEKASRNRDGRQSLEQLPLMATEQVPVAIEKDKRGAEPVLVARIMKNVGSSSLSQP